MNQIVTCYQNWQAFALGSLIVSLSLTLTGCATPPAVSQMSTVARKVPVITPQAETKERQDKGGVEISIAPVAYTIDVQRQMVVKQIQPPPFVMRQGDVYVHRTTTPTAEITPNDVRFMLTVNNKMPRVFHGAGTVVQFNVGGRLQAVDQRGYSKFLGAIIPPRQEQQIEIIGPPLSSLTSDTGIIGVFLYDVVTKLDDAGVVTEKQNFEWYFNYTLQPHDQAVESRSEEVWMSAGQYGQELSRQSMEAARRFQTVHPEYPVGPR